MANRRIAVLYGGRADEHSISCISAAGVLKAMDRSRFDPVPIGITKQGEWVVGGSDPREFGFGHDELPVVREDSDTRRVVLDVADGKQGFFARNKDGSLASLGTVDAVFPVLHGPFGEDGTIQGLLEMMGVPYVGCGVFASAVSMDKHFTKIVLRGAGIDVTPGITLDTRRFDAADGFASSIPAVLEQIGDAGLHAPLFVKPSRAGSSFGVHRIDDPADAAGLAAALHEAASHDWKVLVEQGIDGREIECAVLADDADGHVHASWPGEIVLDHRAGASDGFYDFNSKYLDFAASHVEVPAHLPPQTLEAVRTIAIKAFRAIDGTGLCRVDTFVTAQGRVIVNELNTLPGFTPISMYPKAWQATGVSYTELITRLIEGVMPH